ncbi:MAG TPA: sialate O-acetylesterase [Chthoniobacteraceae bacterium]|jgi:sialate O-acetylesterase|nr:sialate O-acetylesterase [Chthoniobacteraceae bacterium]
MNRRLPSLSLGLGLLLAVASGSAPCRANIVLPPILSDNMVLQQRDKVNIWGKADPGENITVQMGPYAAQAVADKEGNWGVKLAGIKSGGPYELTVFGKNSVTVHNVAVGEVWVCSGETNMDQKVITARGGLEESADGDLPMVRVFTVWHNPADKPETECDGSWVVCDPMTARNYSAIGFFFARELNRGMHVPIGLIQSAWGPSPIESWIPRETLEKDPALRGTLERYEKASAAYPKALAEYQTKLAGWKVAAEAAKAAGSPAPWAPMPPLNPSGARQPGALYNGMISPLLRFPIRGVLWYQGESNTYEPDLYRKLFPALITSWRKAWNEGDFPFLYAQISGFPTRHDQPEESEWANLREAQVTNLPKAAMAVTVDLADPNDMHPKDKKTIAHRLALLAESQVYGKTGLDISGPVFSGMQIEGGKAVLAFSHAPGGLVDRKKPPLEGFQIAGEDRKFVWADAAIQGDKVVVQSKEVPSPVAVRYAWADLPNCDLENKDGLPAAPFRTDHWVEGESASSPTPTASPTPARHHHRAARDE